MRLLAAVSAGAIVLGFAASASAEEPSAVQQVIVIGR
jgi:hypothetical protein